MSKGIPKGRPGTGRSDTRPSTFILRFLACRALLSSEKLEYIAGPAGLAVDAVDVYWANLKAFSSAWAGRRCWLNSPNPAASASVCSYSKNWVLNDCRWCQGAGKIMRRRNSCMRLADAQGDQKKGTLLKAGAVALKWRVAQSSQDVDVANFVWRLRLANQSLPKSCPGRATCTRQTLRFPSHDQLQ